MSSWDSIWLFWDMLIKRYIYIYMHTDYLSARARWLISRQQKEKKEKKQRKVIGISCTRDPVTTTPPALSWGNRLWQPPLSICPGAVSTQLRWSCSLDNPARCAGLRTLEFANTKAPTKSVFCGRLKERSRFSAAASHTARWDIDDGVSGSPRLTRSVWDCPVSEEQPLQRSAN